MAKLKEYHVTWTIDLSARSPKEAARLALKIQRNKESIATVFKVVEWNSPDDDGKEIDLGY